MANDDGLFENPNKEQQSEENQQNILTAIKGDTSEILTTLQKYGGEEIQLAKEQASRAKSNRKQTQQSQAKLTELVEKGIVIAQNNLQQQRKRSEIAENLQKKQNALLANKQNHKQGKSPKAIAKNADQNAQNSLSPIKKSLAKKGEHSQKQTSEAISAKDKAKKKQDEQALFAKLGWGRDKDGRVRDKHGRYVSEKTLKKHAIYNPSNQNSKESTENEASDRRILDALGGIKDAVNDAENLDPIINATKELSAPFEAIFSTTKATGELIGRGMGKLFGSNKENRWQNKFLGLFRKSQSTTEKQQNRMINWLRLIWKKEEGSSGGIFSKLLMAITLLPSLLKSLFFGVLPRLLGGVLVRVLGATLATKLGGLFKGLGKGLGGIGKGLGGLFKGLGKTALKRLPIIGSMLAFADGGMAGGIGSIIGGVLGSIFGPVGTVIGALFGEKIGVWLGSLDWSKIGDDLKQKWTSLTITMSEMWNDATKWFGNVWNNTSEWVTKKWESLTQTFTNLWKGATQSFSEIWEGIKGWFSDLMPDWVKEGATAVADKAKVVADKAKEVGSAVKDKAVEYGNKIGEAISSGYDSAIQKIQEWKDALGNAFGNAMNSAGNYYVNGISTDGTLQPTSTQSSSNAINSADFAVKNALSTFSGKCAKYVNDALRSVGYQVHGHGKDVATNLLNSNQGFEEVKYDANYIPQIGDVMSIAGHSGAKDSTQKYGHVAIYTEQGWVSDTVQGNKYGNTGAASKGSFEAIQSGEVVPVIARQAKARSTPLSAGLTHTIFNTTQIGAEISAYRGKEQIAGLNQQQTSAYLNAVISKESGGKLDAVNQYGYTGLYQMGAAALVDAGMIKRDAYDAAVKQYGKGLANGSNAQAHKDFLANADNWTIQGGWEAFKQSKTLQDTAMIRITNRNAETLNNKGVFAGSAEHKAGALMAAHLVGAGGATAYLKHGANRKDGNGTSAETYYKTGAKAIASLPHIATMPTAQTSVAMPKTVETYGPMPTVPNITMPATTEATKEVDRILQKKERVEKETLTASPPTAPTPTIVDPILQFLTQDVSERSIAHIVTGGMTRKVGV